jgi:hypothetical protein
MTYPPIFEAPTPPGHALMNIGSAYRDTGLKVPVEKYGPTGHVKQYSRAEELALTPSAG